MPDRLTANQQLNPNDQLVPPGDRTHLVLQGDGNLVLYRNDTNSALWASSTAGKPVNRAVMQGDGNFVCYDAGGKAYWSTGTGRPGSFVVLQDDGNLVVYAPNGTAQWNSATSQDWTSIADDTQDVHLATGEWMHSWASMSGSGLISGHTRTWCTIDLRGFHGSVIPVLLGADGKAIWPPNAQAAKHQYGVDGVWIGTHDRTDYWSNQADPALVAQAKALQCVQFLDPKNMLLTDLAVAGQSLPEIVEAIVAIIGAVG